jgi:type I restriction enzyme S subunit
MEEWKEYKLADVCSRLRSGKGIKSDSVLDSGPYPVIGGNGIRGYANESNFKGECAVIGRQGAYCGNVRFYDGEAYMTEHAVVVVGNELADTRFLACLLSLMHLGNLSAQSAQPGISVQTLSKLIVNLPSIDYQKRVSAVIKSLDDKIEVNRQINDNLEQQAQALFKSWFVDFEPFKNQPFVESELGMIPQGWKVGCLDDLCSFISRGLTPKYDETSDELILGQTCVRNNIVTLNNARKHRPKSKTEKWVQQWDILLNSTGIGSLGRVGVVYFNMDNVAIDSHITVVRTSKSLYRHYVGRNLLSRQLEIENMAVGSTGQTELPRDRVKTMTIIVPSDDALTKFNYIIEPMALTMYRNIEENARLAELRDTLLPKLMSGELIVSDIKI